ncbi:MAG: ligase-associated DNA damage response exonuclease [Bacteroidota bacterium]
MGLISHTKNGLYVEPAKVYIDPWRKVDNALITHGHSDHARWGHKYYVCATSSVNILKHRLGHDINIRGIDYGEALTVNGVRFSFHPAGHITGSAQVRVEYQGEIWVATGDYKIEDDGLCEPYEPVACHHFITECTFGLPVYRWRPQKKIMSEINMWWSKNVSLGKTSVITAYSLGKAQRIINSVDHSIGPIYTHGAVENMNQVYRESGIPLPETIHLNPKTDTTDLPRGLVVCTPGAVGTPWMKRIKNFSLGAASGWMMIRGNRRRRGADRGFVLSDHCDWDGLNQAIEATGATHIYPTHGNTTTFSQYLREQGYHAQPIETEFGDEQVDDDGGTGAAR